MSDRSMTTGALGLVLCLSTIRCGDPLYELEIPAIDAAACAERCVASLQVVVAGRTIEGVCGEPLRVEGLGPGPRVVRLEAYDELGAALGVAETTVDLSVDSPTLTMQWTQPAIDRVDVTAGEPAGHRVLTLRGSGFGAVGTLLVDEGEVDPSSWSDDAISFRVGPLDVVGTVTVERCGEAVSEDVGLLRESAVTDLSSFQPCSNGELVALAPGRCSSSSAGFISLFSCHGCSTAKVGLFKLESGARACDYGEFDSDTFEGRCLERALIAPTDPTRAWVVVDDEVRRMEGISVCQSGGGPTLLLPASPSLPQGNVEALAPLSASSAMVVVRSSSQPTLWVDDVTTGHAFQLEPWGDRQMHPVALAEQVVLAESGAEWAVFVLDDDAAVVAELSAPRCTGALTEMVRGTEYGPNAWSPGSVLAIGCKGPESATVSVIRLDDTAGASPVTLALPGLVDPRHLALSIDEATLWAWDPTGVLVGADSTTGAPLMKTEPASMVGETQMLRLPGEDTLILGHSEGLVHVTTHAGAGLCVSSDRTVWSPR